MESQKSHNSYFARCRYFKKEQHSQTGKLGRKSSFPSHGMVTSSRIATLRRQVRTFREGPHLSVQPKVCHVMLSVQSPRVTEQTCLFQAGAGKLHGVTMQGHKAFKGVLTSSQYSSIPETGCRGHQQRVAGTGAVPEGGEAAKCYN